MIEIVWEYIVKEEARGHFELAFGPGGAWSNLFSGSPGFRGATLLRDMEDPQRYLAIDLWDTPAQREQALGERKAEYANLDATLAGWTESRREVGVFRALAEATVRPWGKSRRGRAGGAGRRNL
jgi:heme-degrading monooxygenase HmoA